MAQVQTETFMQVTGIQPVGTIVYQSNSGWTETVLASDPERGKQLVGCQGLESQMYRIEYLDLRGHDSSVAAYTKEDAWNLYNGL